MSDNLREAAPAHPSGVADARKKTVRDPGALIDTIARRKRTFGRARQEGIRVPAYLLGAPRLAPARPRGAITRADAS